MRPINLIPSEQRRGSGSHGQGKGVGTYAVLGGLGVAVVLVLAFVMASNSLNSKSEKLAGLQTEAQGAKLVADALRPYGQFADLQRARHQQVTSLTDGRFDWERALRQLSLAIPRNVYLLNVAATESPEVEVEEGGSGGDLATLRKATPAPAFVMSGCTYSQHAVARMMTRMRNLDDVTEVRLAKSARIEGADAGTAVASDPAQQDQDIEDCIGSARVTKFDLFVAFGGAEDAAAAAGQAGVPPGSAAPIAAAQGAVDQSAAAPAGGTP